MKTFSRYSFLIISESIFDFGLPKSQNSTDFIRYFHQPFRMRQNIVLLTFFDDSGGYLCHFAAVDPLGPENPAWNQQYAKRGFLARWKN